MLTSRDEEERSMLPMSDGATCPKCGAALAAEAPKGLCPRCLLKVAVDAGSATGDVAPDATTSYSSSVLASLCSAVGPMPLIRLPEASLDGTGVPQVPPSTSSSEIPSSSDRSSRYQISGEIARGGMGAVLRGRDPDLGRELAIKVLLERHNDEPAMIRRFVEEAQIGGQLQHPGIVPVYEFGAFANARPYFTMKLVEGRTLAFLLAGRKAPGDDLPRFLSIFESIAQTVAYAHSRGVIHRDLKPSNVMVGSFGEVQVMDWGLAKVLGRRGSGDEAAARPDLASPNVVCTPRSGSDADDSRPGSVLGTPSYMAPEQAAGEIPLVDERADVFGLGAILCEILTAHRPTWEAVWPRSCTRPPRAIPPLLSPGSTSVRPTPNWSPWRRTAWHASPVTGRATRRRSPAGSRTISRACRKNFGRPSASGRWPRRVSSRRQSGARYARLGRGGAGAGRRGGRWRRLVRPATRTAGGAGRPSDPRSLPALRPGPRRGRQPCSLARGSRGSQAGRSRPRRRSSSRPMARRWMPCEPRSSPAWLTLRLTVGC